MASPRPSNIHNAHASVAPQGLPTYDEAMARTNRVVKPFDVGDVLQHAHLERDQLIAQWEARKWGLVRDSISAFANSHVAAEGNFPAEKVLPAVRAMSTWTAMMTNDPPGMKQGDPYCMVMDKANVRALTLLGTLHNELLNHARQLEPVNPSCGKHFVDLANRIRRFIEATK